MKNTGEVGFMLAFSSVSFEGIGKQSSKRSYKNVVFTH